MTTSTNLPMDCQAADRPFEMLNGEQRDFPLVARPFALLSERYGLSIEEVMSCYCDWLDKGVMSRVGGVFHQAAGGASLLAAMAVPPHDLDRVADIVSQSPGVNHNYEREHVYNLWFVMTGQDAATVEAEMQALDAQTGYQALRLPMVRPYRIDLAFDLKEKAASHKPSNLSLQQVPAIAPADRALAALVEGGIAIVERPYDLWAKQLGWTSDQVCQKIQEWLATGVLRRFGNVVRHHELGFGCNAMTVFDVPQARVDEVGLALAQVPQVTLAYQRARAPGWNYNVYCMVHGTNREDVQAVIDQILHTLRLDDLPHAVLFSLRRFKQTGARRYRDAAHI
ncbi:Lrp/AsnC family transcriptional regulator [beta proteobacterium MWH-UniP1]